MSGILYLILDPGCQVTINGPIDHIFEEIDIFSPWPDEVSLNASIEVLSECFSLCILFLNSFLNFGHIIALGAISLLFIGFGLVGFVFHAFVVVRMFSPHAKIHKLI